MKLKVNLLLGALFIFLLPAYSQKSPIKFGEIPMEDLVMTKYDKDSSAVAVILADFGKAYVSISSVTASLIFERHIRIKILKKDGFKWADASIPLYHSGSAEESVSKLKAVTYNLEGGKIIETELEKSGIFKEKFNRNFNVQKFTLPNVKEGSVIEYSYTIRSEFLSNFPNWQFQYSIPVRLSEYWATIPDFFVMEKYMQGYLTLTKHDVKAKANSGYNENTHHYLLENGPAFKTEPYMTNEDDYVSKINFALAYINFPGQPVQEIMGSWKKLNDKLLESESFGKTITGSNFLKKKTEEVLAGETDPQKKTEKILSYIKNNLEWNGTNDFLADNLKDVFERKKGTTGDINLALASMLEKAGISVDMILLSTRDHGFIRKAYPMSKQFNYVICRVQIDGTYLLLDATEKFLPLGVIPERCINGEGLVISSTVHGWASLETKTKSRSVSSVDLIIDPSAILEGNIAITHDGYAASQIRKRILKDGEDEYIKGVTQSRPKWSVNNSKFESLEDIGASVKETHDLVVNDHILGTPDLLYINPFVSDRIEKNPFTLEERTYPVDYGSAQETVYIAKIKIPDGFQVDEVPQTKLFALPGGAGKYTYSMSVTGDLINFVSNFQINKGIFNQSEYPLLREFYNQVVAKQAEQIVLKRK